MKSWRWIYLVAIVMWIVIAAAIIYGIYRTGSAWCLWVFLIPGCMRLKVSDDDEDDSTDKEDYDEYYDP